MAYGKYITDSVRGNKHIINQDRVLIIDDFDYYLFFLFDGLSRAENAIKGIDIAENFIKNNYKYYKHNIGYNFIDLMFETNKSIIKTTIKECYTTYCSLFLSKYKRENITYSNLGDSRIYRLSNQYFESITIDDNSPSSNNIIFKCLGMDKLRKRDFREKSLLSEQNRYIMATDGFYEILESNKQYFFDILNSSYFGPMKSKIYSQIKKSNADDATYILVDTNV